MTDGSAGELIRELEEQCPGASRCHGCMSWCPYCEDVSRVCDDPNCDTHRRLPEIEAATHELEKEIREAAASFALYETEFRRRDEEGTLRIGNATVTGGYLESELSKVASEIRTLERAYREQVEELEKALRWEAAGIEPVPRRKIRQEVPEQLDLFREP